jgi:hypothetical protein
VADVFPLELTVYAPNELAQRPRSSTDGKPIVRIRAATLRKLCERDHAELWASYLADGTTPTMEELLEAEETDDTDVVALLEDEPPDPIPADDADDDTADDEVEEREPRLHRVRSPSKTKRTSSRRT